MSFEKYLLCLCNTALEIGQEKLQRRIKRCLKSVTPHVVIACLHITHRILVVCLHVIPRVFVSSCPSAGITSMTPQPPLAVLATATNGGLGLYSTEVSGTARATCCSYPHILELCYRVWVMFIAWFSGYCSHPQQMAPLFVSKCGMLE